MAPFGILPGSGLGDVRNELRTALVRSADRTLNAYHGDDPSSTVKGWQKAHDRLQAAVDLNHRDKPTRAKMLYAQGHLDRIASQSLRAKGSKDEARQKVRDAVDEFEDAAKLAPDWPDPYLSSSTSSSSKPPSTSWRSAATPRAGGRRRCSPTATG